MFSLLYLLRDKSHYLHNVPFFEIHNMSSFCLPYIVFTNTYLPAKTHIDLDLIPTSQWKHFVAEVKVFISFTVQERCFFVWYSSIVWSIKNKLQTLHIMLIQYKTRIILNVSKLVSSLYYHSNLYTVCVYAGSCLYIHKYNSKSML